MNHIEIDDQTVTHMMGYLRPEQWADAIRQKLVSESVAWKLIEIQDSRYGGQIKNDVKELVEMNEKDWGEYMRSVNQLRK